MGTQIVYFCVRYLQNRRYEETGGRIRMLQSERATRSRLPADGPRRSLDNLKGMYTLRILRTFFAAIGAPSASLVEPVDVSLYSSAVDVEECASRLVETF